MENKNGIHVVLSIVGMNLHRVIHTFVYKFLVAELQGVHDISAAQTRGKREVWDVAVSRPKVNDAPVVLHFGRGTKVQSELVWWNLAPHWWSGFTSKDDLIGGIWH